MQPSMLTQARICKVIHVRMQALNGLAQPRASRCDEIILLGSRYLRSTLAAALVLFAHGDATAVAQNSTSATPKNRCAYLPMLLDELNFCCNDRDAELRTSDCESDVRALSVRTRARERTAFFAASTCMAKRPINDTTSLHRDPSLQCAIASICACLCGSLAQHKKQQRS
jgi:hypothetical protein